jgi:hypothetical protein
LKADKLRRVLHFLYWYFESLNILFGPIRRFFLKLKFFEGVKKILKAVGFSDRLLGLAKALE